MVSPEKQIWHDFSSGKGGNMFSFIMEMEGVDFKGALEFLARQAGIDLSQYQKGGGSGGQQKERLYEAVELAAKFYQVQFSKNRTPLEYILKKRSFSKQTALDFKIGYSPESGGALTKFLLSRGFKLEELKRAGLSTQRYKSPTDMFRGRIMIPLMDPFGRVIGFTARILETTSPPAGGAPKYINTPQTPLYDKSRHVFGLHLAKEAIRSAGYVVVVEGNLDVIASHQAGIKQVVATAGTAVTEPHLKALGRLTDDIRLAFDQDRAGLQAAERSIPIASKADVSLSIITVSEGKDPDELIKKDPKLWQKAIDNKQYALDWLIDKYKAELDIKSAQGKRQFTNILLKVVRDLSDSVEQDHYVVQISELVGVDPDALRTKLSKTGSQNPTVARKRVNPPGATDKTRQELIKTQNHFLAIMLMQPGLRMYLKHTADKMFPEDPARRIFAILEEDPKFVFGQEIKLLPETRDFVQILVLLYEELYKGLELLELRYEAAQLQARLIQQYVKNKKTELAAIMRESGETPELMKQVKELDKLLNLVKDKING